MPHIVQNNSTKRHNINIPVFYALNTSKSFSNAMPNNLSPNVIFPNKKVLLEATTNNGLDPTKVKNTYITLLLLHEIGHAYFSSIIKSYQLKDFNRDEVNELLLDKIKINANETFADVFALITHFELKHVGVNLCENTETLNLLNNIRDDFNKRSNGNNLFLQNDISFISNEIKDIDNVKGIKLGQFVNFSFSLALFNSIKVASNAQKKNKDLLFENTLDYILNETIGSSFSGNDIEFENIILKFAED